MSPDGHIIYFEADIMRFDGPGGWHGVFLPEEAAAEARFFGRANKLGAIAVQVQIGKATARTSLFPDSKRHSYLLPLKASLRKQEGIGEGGRISVRIMLCA